MKPEDNNKNSKPRSSKKDIFVILLLIVMVVGVIMVIFNTTNRPNKLAYNDFIERVENGSISEIAATPVGGGGNSKLYNIQGEYVEAHADGTKDVNRFVIVIDDNTMIYIQDLITKGDIKLDITFQKLVTVDWFSIITMIILPVGLIIFLIMMMKNAGGSNKPAPL